MANVNVEAPVRPEHGAAPGGSESRFMEDDLQAFESKETATKIPTGWALLFWGLIAWGVYYLWAFTPGLGGWSQEGELAQGTGQAAAGVNVFATVLFTALAAAAAAAILFGVARGRKGR